MSVYIELTVDDLELAFRKNLGNQRKRRAGEPNVRRPLRGIEIKEDTYAVFRVIRADGEEIPLVDSSDAEGKSVKYANFLLQSVQEARMEKHQILDTFGEPYLFLFGEAPRFVDVSAILLNTNDFNWRAEWWANYDKYLRGTKLAEMGARAYLFYDDIIVEGYPIQAQASESAGEPHLVQLNFKMFVSNYANVSFVGDPNFPIRDGVQDLDILLQENNAVDQFANDLSKINASAVNVYTSWMKQVGAVQIQEEIANAKSFQEAQALQKQFQLQQLGLSNQIDVLAKAYGASKEFLSDAKKGGVGSALSNLGKKIVKSAGDAQVDALNIIAENITGQVEEAFRPQQQFDDKAEYDQILADIATQQGGQLLVNTQTGELQAEGLAQEMLNRRREKFLSNQLASQFSLTDVIRQGLGYTAQFPEQNIDQFIRNASIATHGVEPNKFVPRTLPYRSKIADNKDEYTKPSDFTPPKLSDVTGQATKTPFNDIDKQICKRGGSTSAKFFYAAGLINWKYGQGPGGNAGSPIYNSGSGRGLTKVSVGGSGGGYTLSLGKGFRPIFSKSAGYTPSVAGANAGQMGGNFGPGVTGGYGGWGATIYDGKEVKQYGNLSQQQINQNPFQQATGGPFGTAYAPGGSEGQSITPNYKYTKGIGPDGLPQGGAEIKLSPLDGLFGGDTNLAQIQKTSGLPGAGAFGVQSVPGTFDPNASKVCP